MVHNKYNMETYGKRASSTRCPVSKGWLAASLSTTGRICRTGHTCKKKYTYIRNHMLTKLRVTITRHKRPKAS